MTDPKPSALYTFAWVVMALAVSFVGVLHFAVPEPFVRIMPSALPAPLFLVYLSGVCELGLSAALVPRATRRYAAWGLCALFVAVFPANINMAVNHLVLDPANPSPSWVAWARLPFQPLLIAWAWWLARRTPPRSAAAA